ncbi:21547_t:CDS:2 [Gigaspora rosea]|nr:21547_t:CDS:2 [Gigaspora rosea]
MSQSFLSMPKFSKTHLYATPKILYYEFCNASAYFMMVKAYDPNIKRQNLMDAANKEWQKYQKEPEIEIRKLINQYLATTQRQALELIQQEKSKISEYESLLIHTNDKDL